MISSAGIDLFDRRPNVSRCVFAQKSPLRYGFIDHSGQMAQGHLLSTSLAGCMGEPYEGLMQRLVEACTISPVRKAWMLAVYLLTPSHVC